MALRFPLSISAVPLRRFKHTLMRHFRVNALRNLKKIELPACEARQKMIRIAYRVSQQIWNGAKSFSHGAAV